MTLPQGDPRLLETPSAQMLLTSKELARVAYVAADGTPRVFPIFFHWTGEELVLPSFAAARRLKALRRRPAIAVTIDTREQPPYVLLMRGTATITDHDGVLPEYAAVQRRYIGGDEAEQTLAQLEEHRPKMARIALRPEWVGLLDFRERFPAAMAEI